ncbi:MAG: dihydrofolate synthase/folylpolyglutamate synthase [Candidatus Azotimanducaceae bacterium]|jgi:dihydrofolate synthase/folylpolyglutamate synthase
MDYQATIEWLFSQVPVYQTQGARAYKPNLNNILAFSKHLNYPEKGFKSIHIAGTNGKGSTSHMLASIFQEAGYKTGLYTSPHLKDFRERIKVDGQCISEEETLQFINTNKPFLIVNKLSFFEVTVGMAFDHFKRKEVDIAIIETGLGGRLDSTNIIRPELSIITNISLDHTRFLGTTIPEIAAEKAGIIKPAIPIIIGESNPEYDFIFQKKALELGSIIVFADTFNYPQMECELKGLFQIKNQNTVLASIDTLKKDWPKLNKESIANGFKKTIANTGLLGRWQTLSTQPLTICDTGHNVAGIKTVVEDLENHQFDQLHIIFGAVNDKNVSEILMLLPKDAKYYFCQANVPRAMHQDEILTIGKKISRLGVLSGSPKNALKQAQFAASKNDMILVLGSNFVVAEILP